MTLHLRCDDRTWSELGCVLPAEGGFASDQDVRAVWGCGCVWVLEGSGRVLCWSWASKAVEILVAPNETHRGGADVFLGFEAQSRRLLLLQNAPHKGLYGLQEGQWVLLSTGLGEDFLGAVDTSEGLTGITPKGTLPMARWSLGAVWARTRDMALRTFV